MFVIYDIMKIWRKRLTYSLTHSLNDEAVYRTAPATPGLLIMEGKTLVKIFRCRVAMVTKIVKNT